MFLFKLNIYTNMTTLKQTINNNNKLGYTSPLFRHSLYFFTLVHLLLLLSFCILVFIQIDIVYNFFTTILIELNIDYYFLLDTEIFHGAALTALKTTDLFDQIWHTWLPLVDFHLFYETLAFDLIVVWFFCTSIFFHYHISHGILELAKDYLNQYKFLLNMWFFIEDSITYIFSYSFWIFMIQVIYFI